MEIRKATMHELDQAMSIINSAKKHLAEQGIDQWQTGYPDTECIRNDIINEKGYFYILDNQIIGYVCIDFEGEPAYDLLKGTWNTTTPYVVAHRLALNTEARGKGISYEAFRLVEEVAKKHHIYSFRVDTDEDNKKMRHILEKFGFTYTGTIWFDNSEKIAFDKIID